jgi:hypothetical protein
MTTMDTYQDSHPCDYVGPDGRDPVHYRLDPDSPLPITAILSAHAIPRAELAKRCGYTNVTKGIRRLDELREGSLEHYASLRVALAQALDIPLAELDRAADDSKYILWARQDRDYRQDFVPHVIWKTYLTVPSPITIAGMIGASRMLRYEPSTQQPMMFSVEAAENCPEGVPCYGRVTGFYVNYSPDCAVEFDRLGEPVATLARAVRPGQAEVNRGAWRFPC